MNITILKFGEKNKMEFGVTFSHKHIVDLGLSVDDSLEKLTALPIKWVRLCCYWSEIEKSEEIFDFTEIDKVVNFFKKKNYKVILTVGMKSPRYPEYYIPEWIKNKIEITHGKKILTKDRYLLTRTLLFIKTTINHFIEIKSIKVWQLENEPLDPSGDKWLSISEGFLKSEIKLVRRIDKKRKIMVNLWGNELTFRKLYPIAIRLSDIVGLDLYLRCPATFLKYFSIFTGPLDSIKKLRDIGESIVGTKKQLYISELQAEPWEPNEIVTNKDNPKSFLPKHFEENIKYASKINPGVILLWGFEYWLLRKKQGDDRYWNSAKSALIKYNNI